MTDEPIRVLMVEDQNDLREMIGLACAISASRCPPLPMGMKRPRC